MRIVVPWLAICMWHIAQAQGLNNLWMGGFTSQFGVPYGGTNIDFEVSPPSIFYENREMGFRRSSANITDSLGDLLFYTNGYYIANANGDTMVNGTGINPSAYTDVAPEYGLNLSQSHLILPKPDDPDIYYLFHSTIDDQVASTALMLYLTTVDMSLDGGLGAVTNKNQVLINDVLNSGKITGVKHANGRDWWVFCHKANSNTFYRFLVDPTGVGLPTTQSIGVNRPPDVGQVCFSPNGGKFAYYWGIYDLDVFDFDRCTGLFSNHIHVGISDSDQLGGVAFSPNSQLLYVSSTTDVYQYDMTAPDIAASMVHIAEWDGFYSPSPPFATLFDIAQLAPDGKIYIATGNGTDRLHVINAPDVPGMGCDIVQHGVTLPTYVANSLPNHPNYHLGPLAGSPCDTLGVGISEQEQGSIFSLYPNPAVDHAVLEYDMNGANDGFFEMFDVLGRKMLGEILPQGKGRYHLDTSELPQGTYHYAVWSGGEVQGTGVFVVVH